MKRGTTIAQMVVRLAGLFQIVTGLLFWLGNAITLTNVHMLIGLVVVLGLWALAILGWRAHVAPGRVGLAVVWGVIVIVFGVTQTGLLIGDLHWIIEVLHLLVGIGALAQAEMLGARIKASLANGAREGAPRPQEA
jgi:hypothetical protein